MSLKLDLMCNICQMILHDPISLPCHCVVCKDHLSDRSNNFDKIKCVTCNKEFEVSTNEFITNKIVLNILEKEHYLNDQEKSIKKSIQELSNQLEILQADLRINEFEVFSHDHFSEIRRKIDLQRETLKSKIDDIALKMIEKTKKNEDWYTNQFRQKLIKICLLDIKKHNQELLKIFRKTNLIIDEVKLLEMDLEKRIGNLNTIIDDLTALKFEIKSLDFVGINLNLKKDSFGILKLKNLKQKLFSCSEKNNIKIWDMESRQSIASLIGHSEQVQCLEAIDKHRIISGSWDKTIKIWNTKSGDCLKTLVGHRQQILCVKYLTKNTIASGSHNEIKIWNIDNGECIFTLEDHRNWVSYLVSLPNDNLISSSYDKTIKIWDLNQRSCIKTLEDHKGAVYCLLLLENETLASGSTDNTIKIWNIDNGQCIMTLTGHTSYVSRLLLTKKGDLISSSNDKTIKIWSLITNECIKTLSEHSEIVSCIKFSHDGFLLSGSGDGLIKIWNLEGGECVKTIQSQERNINDIDLI